MMATPRLVFDRRWTARSIGYDTIDHAMGMRIGTESTDTPRALVYSYSPNGNCVVVPRTSISHPKASVMAKKPRVHASPRLTNACVTEARKKAVTDAAVTATRAESGTRTHAICRPMVRATNTQGISRNHRFPPRPGCDRGPV